MINKQKDIEEYFIVIEEKAKRSYMAKLAAHPDCIDPEHPGCKWCESDDDDGEEFETCAD
jgi:hypothetical protein